MTINLTLSRLANIIAEFDDSRFVMVKYIPRQDLKASASVSPLPIPREFHLTFNRNNNDRYLAERQYIVCTKICLYPGLLLEAQEPVHAIVPTLPYAVSDA